MRTHLCGSRETIVDILLQVLLHVFSLQAVNDLPEHPIDNVKWLNQAGAVRWDKNDILQASRELWIFAVVCVLCILTIKSFGFSASGLNRHFYMVLTHFSIRSSSHHTFSWNCTLIRLSYSDFSIWKILKPLPRKKRSGGTWATPSAKRVSWAGHSHFSMPEGLPWCTSTILQSPQLHSFCVHVRFKECLQFESECSWEASPFYETSNCLIVLQPAKAAAMRTAPSAENRPCTSPYLTIFASAKPVFKTDCANW